ncbi:death-inducer obliterator 1-like [Senna tora]|uniref:Death-inducer obliterator 1-like n=1 Tax=Senna tora TaxID=362788 RepID=A0A834WRV8_9FABA|nr:death-inducer obliterator 1-like [Senna tora]
MSNNLVSQQLPIPSMQMSQVEPTVSKVDSSGRDSQIGLIGSASSDSMSQQQGTSNNHIGLSRDVPGDPGSQGLAMSVMQSGQIDSHAISLGMHHLVAPNKRSMQMDMRLNSTGPQQLSTLPKRKAATEPLSSSSVTSNKRPAQMDRPWLQQVSNASPKGSQQIHPQSNSPRPQQLSGASGKRKTQMESTLSKAGTPRSSNSKSHNSHMQQSSRTQTESSGLVRSKMRESLAAALALVSQQDRHEDEKNNTLNGAGNAQGKLDNSSQCASAATDAPQVKTQVSETIDYASAVNDTSEDTTKDHPQTLACNEGYFEKCQDSAVESTNMLNFTPVTTCDKQDFQSSYTLTTDDVPFSDTFFVKDDLLQGNGLSWVLDSEMVDLSIQPEIQSNEDQRLESEEVGGACREQTVNSPELLASMIEAELFKLFGGVNKKYKEKGRSLLFNLKDRNNPELRERVMSGEIPPERLCSMTAEELASKELSQWRMAKAEEFAQMVVLPDSDGDFRRLVKKTHKGEFQVEVDHEDNVSVEVSGGATLVSRNQRERKDVEAPLSKPDQIKYDVNTNDGKSILEKDSLLTHANPSSDGTATRGPMADDALKDADFLPPIVSLDEFMESHHSKPLVENLVEHEKFTPNSEKDNPVFDLSSSIDRTADAPDKSDKDHTTRPSLDADHEKRVNAESGAISRETRCSQSHADMKITDAHPEVRSTADKSASSHIELKASHYLAEDKFGSSQMHSKNAASSSISKGEHIWEGMLQPNISTTHSVISIFKSGEKTSVIDWPGFLEIKGRVRLEAFEKFLQELPMSRTRAIMVLHFVSKEDPHENEKAILREVADSYILDERVGFAEPVPGVELYFCPPHKKTVEMLSKILPMEQIEAVNAIDFGLIGINVWRKTHLTSTISPTSSSHHKHSFKKQYSSTRRQQETNMNTNVPKAEPSMGLPDDDDVPPGFGPPVARDEDDLPEFNFSGRSNPSHLVQNPFMRPVMPSFHTVNPTTSRPVDQMRELVHKYGQSEENASRNLQDKFGATIQPWNDDDDDDIPEWQPHTQTPQNQFLPQQSIPNFQLRPHMVNQPYGISPHQSHSFQQSPMNVTQGHQNISPLLIPPTQGSTLQPPRGGHPYGSPPAQGTAWRQNVPRSRGF